MLTLSTRHLRPLTLSLMLAIAGTFALPLAYSQGPDGPPQRIDFAGALGLDATTASAFEQVMRAQHARRKELGIDRETLQVKHELLRQETDQKLAKLLTPQQLKKFHELRQKPPGHERPRREGNRPPPNS